MRERPDSAAAMSCGRTLPRLCLLPPRRDLLPTGREEGEEEAEAVEEAEEVEAVEEAEAEARAVAR